MAASRSKAERACRMLFVESAASFVRRWLRCKRWAGVVDRKSTFTLAVISKKAWGAGIAVLGLAGVLAVL